jgi:Tfp pilus assembly PilM family ATPase/Tfp pilus assembly protein PilN
LAPGLVSDGNILDPQKLGTAIDSLFAEKNIPRKGVFVSFPSAHAVTRILSLPKLKSSLREEAIYSEADREMPIPIAELYLSWQSLGTNESNETKYFLVGIPRNSIDSLVTALKHARITPHSVSPKSLALVRAINRRRVIIADIEEDSLELVLVTEGIPVIMRTISVRGKELAATDKVSHLASELSRVVDFYNSSRPEHALTPDTPVYVTGGLSDGEEIRRLLASSISFPIRSLKAKARCPAIFSMSQYAVNMGLTPKGGAQPSVKSEGANLPVAGLNIMPSDLRPHRIRVKQVIYPMALVFSTAFLLSSYFTVSSQGDKVSQLRADLARAESQVDMAKETLAAVNELEDQAATLESEQERLLQTTGFAETLEGLTEATDADVSLTSISQTADQVSISGSATNQKAAVAYAMLLESNGTLPNQSLTIAGGNEETELVSFKIVVRR